MAGTPPPVRLRVELEHARQGGAQFRAAWPDAVRAALDGLHTSAQRAAWREALAATKHGWHAAYTRRPGPGDSLTGELFPSD